MTEEDLDLVPLEVLFDALQRRFDQIWVVGVIDRDEKEEEHVWRRCYGDAIRLIGMMEREKYELLSELCKDKREGGED